MSRALTLQALLVALLAASALASPLSMRRGLRAAGEKDESWVADEKTVEALKGVWKGEVRARGEAQSAAAAQATWGARWRPARRGRPRHPGGSRTEVPKSQSAFAASRICLRSWSPS